MTLEIFLEHQSRFCIVCFQLLNFYVWDRGPSLFVKMQARKIFYLFTLILLVDLRVMVCVKTMNVFCNFQIRYPMRKRELFLFMRLLHFMSLQFPHLYHENGY